MRKNSLNHMLYIILFSISLTIIIGSFFITANRWFTIITGIGCGGFASVLIAWLIELSKNKRTQEIKKEKYFEIYDSMWVHFALFLVAFARCAEISSMHKLKTEKHTWIE